MKKQRKIRKYNNENLFSLIKYYAIGIYKKSDEDHIWILSSGIAFNLLICAIPFTLIIFSILGIYLSLGSTLEGIEQYINTTISLPPDLQSKFHNLVFSKINEISEHRTLTALIGIVGILWTASGLFSTIRDVLNKIYKRKSEVFYLWGKLKDIGMVLLSTIFFILSVVSTFIVSVIKNIDEKFLNNTLSALGFFQNALPFLIGLIFSFLMFYVIYKLVPYGNIKNKIVLISSVSSTILWELLKIIFSIYLLYFSNFTAVYGAYGAIVAVIFWIYYSSFTFVVGAEIGQLYHEKNLLFEGNKSE